MGALHAGHASLIQAARGETGWVVVSIFVNPKQFGPQEDLSRYPRTWEADLSLCAQEKVDLIFAPQPSTMYPAGFSTFVEVQGLQNVLCGASRPGHFRGVATVVLKLLNIVQPDIAYFGHKDAQQARIIRQMVRDLDVPIQLRVCPTLREPDGLALSSRNQYLTETERQRARILYQTLTAARDRIEAGERDGSLLQQAMAARIQATPGAILDYAAVVDAESLRPLQQLRGHILLALAVKFGETRLIDNLTVRVV
jgi:pantoate--beta-alanine ligase